MPRTLSNSLQHTHHEFVEWDAWLRNERKQKRQKLDKVRSANAAKEEWNTEHPEGPVRIPVDEPYVPQLSVTGVDLSQVIGEFGGLEPASLSVRSVVDALTKWGPERGFAQERFDPMYHIYRKLSSTSVHFTLDILEEYVVRAGFVRTLPTVGDISILEAALPVAMYLTAFLAGWVLGDAGSRTVVSTFLRNQLEPAPDGSRPW